MCEWVGGWIDFVAFLFDIKYLTRGALKYKKMKARICPSFNEKPIQCRQCMKGNNQICLTIGQIRTYTYRWLLRSLFRMHFTVASNLCKRFSSASLGTLKIQLILSTNRVSWAVVVTQLVKWSLPTPEVHSSNPVIGKIYINRIL